jgi:hypothetical protein
LRLELRAKLGAVRVVALPGQGQKKEEFEVADSERHETIITLVSF